MILQKLAYRSEAELYDAYDGAFVAEIGPDESPDLYRLPLEDIGYDSPTGEPATIAGYLGKGDTFDRAIADFAVAYADQNERDYAAFNDTYQSYFPPDRRPARTTIGVTALAVCEAVVDAFLRRDDQVAITTSLADRTLAASLLAALLQGQTQAVGDRFDRMLGLDGLEVEIGHAHLHEG